MVTSEIKIVVAIDDDFRVRESLESLVESAGYVPRVFSTAEKFLESGVLKEAGCVITDVRMPGMDGLHLQSHVAATECNIPIIFITAYDDKESRQQALQAGAIAFLSKPFNDELLLQTVRAALGHNGGSAKTT